MRNVRNDSMRWFNIALHLALFCAAVFVYSLTLNPDVQPADSGEFQIAAFNLGIPHPPGYPLYTMLGWLFAQAPVASPFARITFLSVIASAATLVLVGISIQKSAGMLTTGWKQPGNESHIHRWAGVLFGLMGALALGTSTTFWAQATTTNIRSLTAFFTALMIYAMVRIYGQNATRDKDTKMNMCLFALALGLGVGHHVSLVFIGAIMTLSVTLLTVKRRIPLRSLAPAGICLIASQLVWLYLPLRDAAGARFAPGNLSTLDGLLFHIFARGFAGDMLAFAAPQYLSDRLALLPTLFQFEFSTPILALLLIGMVSLLVRRRTIDLTLLSAFIAHMFITITYRAPQTVEYAMPAWVILCVLLGSGGVAVYSYLGRLVNIITNRLRHETHTAKALFATLCILLVVYGVFLIRDGLDRFPSFLALSNDRSTRSGASGALSATTENSTVLSQWHQATPMWALQDIEGLRRDVHVAYIYPRGEQPYADTFADQAVTTLANQATYATSNFINAFERRGLNAIPQLQPALWRLTHGTADPPIDQSQGSRVFENLIEVGKLQPLVQSIRVGQALDVNVVWRLRNAIATNTALTIRIIRPDGRLAANADIRLDKSSKDEGWKTQQVRLGIPVDLAPGSYEVVIGAYRAVLNGFESLTALDGDVPWQPALITVQAADQPPVTQHILAQSFPNGAVLMGVDYDTGISGKWRVLTHWLLPSQPITISIQDAANATLGRIQTLPAIQGAPGYFTLVFDIPPMLGLRIACPDLQTPFAIPDGSPDERYIPFADQMILTSATTHRESNVLKVDFTWLAMRPLMTDYIVSARAEGESIHAAHDGVPALGALPTLKWISGSHVLDRHPIELGDYIGALRGSVVVYDSATQQPLPPLDERYENGITYDVR